MVSISKAGNTSVALTLYVADSSTKVSVKRGSVAESSSSTLTGTKLWFYKKRGQGFKRVPGVDISTWVCPVTKAKQVTNVRLLSRLSS